MISRSVIRVSFLNKYTDNQFFKDVLPLSIGFKTNENVFAYFIALFFF